MYLSHHYLIDLTGGACLSVIVFYALMPEVFKDVDAIMWNANGNGIVQGGKAYEGVSNGTGTDGLDLDAEIRKLEESGEGDVDEAIRDEEAAIEARDCKG